MVPILLVLVVFSVIVPSQPLGGIPPPPVGGILSTIAPPPAGSILSTPAGGILSTIAPVLGSDSPPTSLVNGVLGPIVSTLYGDIMGLTIPITPILNPAAVNPVAILNADWVINVDVLLFHYPSIAPTHISSLVLINSQFF